MTIRTVPGSKTKNLIKNKDHKRKLKKKNHEGSDKKTQWKKREIIGIVKSVSIKYNRQNVEVIDTTQTQTKTKKETKNCDTK